MFNFASRESPNFDREPSAEQRAGLEYEIALYSATTVKALQEIKRLSPHLGELQLAPLDDLDHPSSNSGGNAKPGSRA